MSGNMSTNDTLDYDVAAVFRARLIRLRQERAVSREVISELCGLPTNSVYRYEAGGRLPSLRALVKLADYFGVSVDYLLGKTDSR